MPSSSAPTEEFASGQAKPVWPADQPLGLLNEHYVPARLGHPPPGTVPDDILPAGTARPKLFESLDLPHSKLRLKNRVIVSPMCQYSSKDGFLTPYHLAHLGSFALHGAGTIIVEASAVTAAGRITPQDAGIWKDEHIASHASIVSSLKTMSAGLTVGIQLAHAGRKASTWSPYHRGDKKQQHYVTTAEGGWEEEVVAPSAIAYDEGHITPKELSTQAVKDLIQDFIQGARRAFKAGYDAVEIHSAHGYLLHSFISPLSNRRTDEYGGSFENRTRALREIVEAINKEYPDKSVWVRVSGTDFAEHVEGSWTVEDTKKLAQQLAETASVDLLDCSAGGLVPFQKITPAPGYQLFLAQGVSSLKIPKSKLLVGSVGMLEGPDAPGQLAEELLQRGDADAVLLARGFLAKPTWVLEAGIELLGFRTADTPQYHRVHPVATRKPPARAQNTN